MTARGRILLVDDETSIQRAVAPLLRSRGYDVEIASTGAEALRFVSDRAPDLIVLDLGLPDIEGTEVCRRIRENLQTPIIILSARGAEADKVNALDLGADDYVTKPFSPRELIARVRAILRRARVAEAGRPRAVNDEILREGDITINLTSYEVRKGDQPLELTPREFELLRFLMAHAGQVFSRESLLEEVWGYDYYGDVRTVDVTVRRLREKLEENTARPEYIKTRRGVGYYFQRFD